MKNAKTLLPIIGFIIIIFLCFSYLATSSNQEEPITITKKPITPTPEITKEPTPTIAYADSIDESNIYSFLQGPKSWKKGYRWSGSWANLSLDGNVFGNFGCGLCCMANIYSTLSPYKCSPIDMYQFAKDHSSYSPSRGYGAIDWPAISDTLACCGIENTYHNKPEHYEAFQELIASSPATIVLVSSYNCTKLWEDTPGHYVTILNYHQEDDTVFLCDSGSPARNRHRVPLSQVYDSLKTSSSYQLLTTTGYSEESNIWKWNQTSEEWNRP